MPNHHIYISLETGKYIQKVRPFSSFDSMQFSQNHSFLAELEEICLNHSAASRH